MLSFGKNKNPISVQMKVSFAADHIPDEGIFVPRRFCIYRFSTDQREDYEEGY